MRITLPRRVGTPRKVTVSEETLEHQLTARASHWREVLTGDPALARKALQALMAGPIRFEMRADGYNLYGVTKLGALLFENETQKPPALRWCREGESNPHDIAIAGF